MKSTMKRLNSLFFSRQTKIIIGVLFSLSFLLMCSTIFNTVHAQSVVFIDPNSSTVWQQGQTVTIKWGDSTGECLTDPENPWNMRPDLNLYKEDTGFIYTIRSRFDLVNCSIVWHIPSNLTSGNDYRIEFYYYGEMPGTGYYTWDSELFTIALAIPAYSVLVIVSSLAIACFIIVRSIRKNKKIKLN